jgi:VWFA-related protein
MGRRRLVLLLGIAVAVSATAQDTPPIPKPPVAAAESGQVAPPAFPAEIEQVIVDLVVVDKDGNPVPGLTKDDLIVSEDDVSQTIVSFEAVEMPDEPAAEPPPPPRVSVNTDVATQRARVFVIVFDDLNLAPARSTDAKAAVASFLTNGVREGDHVTLIATGGEAWWTARMASGRDQLIDVVKRLQGRRIPDFTPERITDWEAMRIHLYHDELVIGYVLRRYESYGVQRLTTSNPSNLMAGTTADPVLATRATQVYFEARARNQATLGVLERALNGLSGVKGRKSVILVSEGFIDDPNLDLFRRVNEASRRSNAAVYFVNASGLAGMGDAFTGLFGPAPVAKDVGFAFSTNDTIDDGSEGIAEDSGGFTVKNTNDLDAGIDRIARESQIYYLLGYNSTNRARDGAFRKIEVRLKDGRGLKIRARKGYYAPSDTGDSAPDGKPGRDPVVQAALDSPWAEDAIPLRMTHFVGGEGMLGKVQVVLVTEVDVRALEFAEKDGRHVTELGIHLIVAHRETGEFYRYDQDITLSLRPETLERFTRVWFPIERDFEIQEGDHQAKIIVREKGTGLVGSVIHEFEVPPLDEFRVSTPVLSDTPRRDPSTGALEPQPLARREFTQGGKLVCQIDVFGAARDAAGMPRVAQGHEVRRPDGTLYKRLPESLINPSSLGALSRMFTLTLDRATPGEYEILMNVRDEISGKTLEVREPFTVVPPTPPATTGATGGQASPSS